MEVREWIDRLEPTANGLTDLVKWLKGLDRESEIVRGRYAGVEGTVDPVRVKRDYPGDSATQERVLLEEWMKSLPGAIAGAVDAVGTREWPLLLCNLKRFQFEAANYEYLTLKVEFALSALVMPDGLWRQKIGEWDAATLEHALRMAAERGAMPRLPRSSAPLIRRRRGWWGMFKFWLRRPRWRQSTA